MKKRGIWCMIRANTDGAAGAGSDRRPSVVPAPAATAPEMSDRPRRRTFTAQTKLRVLAETDSAAGVGGIGAILRREGLYSPTLTDWRRQRDSGALGALTPTKRGPKPAVRNVSVAGRNHCRLSVYSFHIVWQKDNESDTEPTD